MSKKLPKDKHQVRLETRFAIFVVFLIYNMVFVWLSYYTANDTPYVTDKLSSLISFNFITSSIIMLWANDLKNIRGWWAKLLFKKKQQYLHRREIEDRLLNERKMGYGEIERQ